MKHHLLIHRIGWVLARAVVDGLNRPWESGSIVFDPDQRGKHLSGVGRSRVLSRFY